MALVNPVPTISIPTGSQLLQEAPVLYADDGLMLSILGAGSAALLEEELDEELEELELDELLEELDEELGSGLQQCLYQKLSIAWAQ